MPGTAVRLLWLLMLYHRLTRDVDMAEEAELRVLEDGDVRGGASRRHSECAYRIRTVQYSTPVLLYDSNRMEKSGRGSVAAWSRCRSRHAVWVLGWV